jgi:hypothetical protein
MWKLQVYKTGASKEPEQVLECKSADAARTRAIKLRRLPGEAADANIWFRIIDPLDRLYQETEPSEKWRIKWYWKLEPFRNPGA